MPEYFYRPLDYITTHDEFCSLCCSEGILLLHGWGVITLVWDRSITALLCYCRPGIREGKESWAVEAVGNGKKGEAKESKE